jgi:hypothetical protein
MALLSISGSKNFLGEKFREKSLGKVLGILNIVTLPANETIEGIPIGSANLLQRLIRRFTFRLDSPMNETPMRCTKESGTVLLLHKNYVLLLVDTESVGTGCNPCLHSSFSPYFSRDDGRNDTRSSTTTA